MVVWIRPPTCGLPVAIHEFVVYRDPTGCLTAFYFSPFEVRGDSNPSGDGLSHLNRIKLGGAATTTLHTYKLPLEPTKLHFSPFGIKHQKEDREKESVAHWKRVRGLHLPLLLDLPLHGQSYPYMIASFDTIDHLFLPLVLDT